jgi:hypothetical protein
MNLTDLKASWALDSVIDSRDLDREALRTANLHQKYLDLLMDFKMKVLKKDREFLTMKGLRSKYYSGQCTREELAENGWDQYQYKTPLKSELERLLETDPYLLALKDATTHYTLCFEYTEEVMKSIRSRSYDIKTAVEWQKFQAGS